MNTSGKTAIRMSCRTLGTSPLTGTSSRGGSLALKPSLAWENLVDNADYLKGGNNPKL